MVNHGGNVLEKPLVRAISYPVDIFVLRAYQIGPTLGDDGADAGRLNRVKDDLYHLGWVVQHDAAESNVHWSRASLEEKSKIWWRRVLGCVTEKEPTNIYTVC